MPQVGVCRSLHCQVRSLATASEIEREIMATVPQLLEAVCFQPWVGHVNYRNHIVTCNLLNGERVTP